MEDLKTKVEDIKTKAEHLTDHVSDYVETYLKLGAVNATEKATGVATVTLTAIMLSICCLFVCLFAGVGIALWLGEVWGNTKAGYFAVAGFYVVCALLFVTFRKTIIFPYVRDQIIKKVYE
jgi:hypothetical protein